MRSLADTVARLKRLPRGTVQPAPKSVRLRPFTGFGPNPGELDAWIYVPPGIRAGAPLVVVLHGCTQNAAGYDESTGWSRLAEKHGFALLYPAQRRANNPNLCFNWFSADDSARGKGEVRSIREMVAGVQAWQATDPGRVFVTGLSAGGAMTAAMLATYPELFAGGAVIAGLPFGVARSVPEAFERMRGREAHDAAALTQLVRAASTHSGKWPTLSVWHGSADRTVDQVNASALVEQWRSLHGAPPRPSRTDVVNGYPHCVWRDGDGRDVIEEYRITGLAHGTPLDTRSRHGEKAAPFMLEAGISSTRLIARFWDIVPEDEPHVAAIVPQTAAPAPRPAQAPGGITKTIEDALRTAGLMK